MAVHKTSRSGLFLLELMIVILFFAVTSAVCVNLFVQAHLTSTAGGELTAATREVQSAAEWLKAADGDLEKLAAQLDAKAADGRLDLYFDVGWNRTGAQDAIYTVTVLWRRPTHGAARRRRDCSGPNRPGGLFFSGGCGLE